MLLKLAKNVVSTIWLEVPGDAIDSVLDAEPEDEDQ